MSTTDLAFTGRRRSNQLRSQRRYRPSWIRWLTLAACWLTSARALADPAGQARFHDELARNHYQAGRLEQALREFFLEQRISPNPRIAFNIALCFQGLKRNEEAFQYLSEYLASSDDDPDRRAYSERVVASLKQSLALVRVQSVPEGADIYIDRRELGSYGATPRVIALTPGQHRVWAELAGYSAASAEVDARRAQESALQLTPERITGQLSVKSATAGRVSVRSPTGETVSQGDAPLQLSLPPGTYQINVSSDGHLPWAGVAYVEANKTADVSAAPLPAPAATGNITVTSNVPGALIELNGEPAGFSPTVLSNLKVGTHQMRVQSAALLPWSGKVAVAAEDRSWLTVSLEEPPQKQLSTATWVTGGVAAVGLVCGGILSFLAWQTHADFRDAPQGTDRTAFLERGEALNTAADVAWITTGLAAGAALALYFTTNEVGGRPSGASLTRTTR